MTESEPETEKQDKQIVVPASLTDNKDHTMTDANSPTDLAGKPVPVVTELRMQLTADHLNNDSQLMYVHGRRSLISQFDSPLLYWKYFNLAEVYKVKKARLAATQQRYDEILKKLSEETSPLSEEQNKLKLYAELMLTDAKNFEIITSAEFRVLTSAEQIAVIEPTKFHRPFDEKTGPIFTMDINDDQTKVNEFLFAVRPDLFHYWQHDDDDDDDDDDSFAYSNPRLLELDRSPRSLMRDNPQYDSSYGYGASFTPDDAYDEYFMSHIIPQNHASDYDEFLHIAESDETPAQTHNSTSTRPEVSAIASSALDNVDDEGWLQSDMDIYDF